LTALDGWRFCPRCAAAIRREPGRAVCDACGFVAYASSAPTASAVLVDAAGRVLLGRRAVEPELGKWDLPGGFLGEGEEPLTGLRRELREETGLDVEPLSFLGAWVDSYGDGADAEATLNLYWLVRADGVPRAADDVAELHWFAPDALPPPGELAFRVNAVVLAAWQRAAAPPAGEAA
jgi:ADP-ribose pyrophosphatase YjhB (NUDIX family)